MSKTLRLLSLLLVLITVVSCFAACGGGEKENTDKETNQENNNTENNGTEKPPVEVDPNAGVNGTVTGTVTDRKSVV